MSEAGASATRSPEERGDWVGVRVAQHTFALPLEGVLEIRRPLRLAELPRMPAYVRGAAHHRGEVIPILDLARRLGLPRAADADLARQPKSERLVVAIATQGKVGLLVSEIVGVFREAVRTTEGLIHEGVVYPILNVDELVDFSR